MKKLKLIIITSLLLAMSIFLPAQTAVKSWGKLHIDGPKIVNEHNKEIQLQGMSLFWSQWEGKPFYEYNTLKWLRDDWCVNVVRAAMGIEDSAGYNMDPQGNDETVRTAIQAAIDLDIYIMVDWHSHYAQNDRASAIKFFSEIAEDFGNHPNIIYEIYNEPRDIGWNDLKGYHEEVIAAIRQHDPDNIIICGTPEYSSRPDHAAWNPINQNNIAYSLHYYAASHRGEYRNRAESAMNNGLCVFVTEYGTTEFNGNGGLDAGSSNEWWNWMEHHKIGHCNWSISNKNEASSALTPNAPAGGFWTDDHLTASGKLVRNYLRSKCPTYDPPIPVTTYVPGKLEAENYSGQEGIQNEVTTDVGGGHNVGYLDANDWLEYLVNASGTGEYEFTYRLASKDGGGSFNLLIDNTLEHTITVPQTGDWQSWEDLVETVNLTAGDHVFRIEVIEDGWNFNYVNITGDDIPDCNGDINGTASIDECDVCSGGNTGTPPNACNGGCFPGIGPIGIRDDFTLAEEPSRGDGAGIYWWGEATLGGDGAPNFQALIDRNPETEKLEVTISQGEGEYQPFGFSFGGSPQNTIDISSDATFEIEFSNPSDQDLIIALAIQDVDGRVLNTNSKAGGEPFSDAWRYPFSTKIHAGATIVYSGDFAGGFNADYNQGAFDPTFDYTQVATVMLTVTNQENSGAPNYTPIGFSQVLVEINELRFGDCSTATNDNAKDCNGVYNGEAFIDDCNKCAGGNTGMVPNSSCVVASNESLSKPIINVYPNPTSGIIHLNGISDWTLFNSIGFEVSKGTNELIDLSNFPSGVYLIKSETSFIRVVRK